MCVCAWAGPVCPSLIALHQTQIKPTNPARAENVARNMEMAMEEMPEAFGQVVMLYIDAEVNGQPIKVRT